MHVLYADLLATGGLSKRWEELDHQHPLPGQESTRLCHPRKNKALPGQQGGRHGTMH